MSKGILFMNNISNHQGTHLQKSETDNVKDFNMIYELNWPRKDHKTTAERRTWRKSMITSCSESKQKLRTKLGQWILDDNKYMTYWQWFLFHDLHTLYYRYHETRCKYIQLPNRARRCIKLQTYTK